MTTPTPMLDAAFEGDDKGLGAARELYALYKVTELEAMNIVQLARFDQSLLMEAVQGLKHRKRKKPLP